MRRFLLGRSAGVGERIQLPRAAASHAARVLRLKPGEEVELFDGSGVSYRGAILSITSKGVEVEIRDEILSSRECPVDLVLAVGLSKGAKLDWVVEKVTELGVHEIRPFVSSRTIQHERDTKRIARWRRIAESASAQSGRACVPRVADVSTFSDVLSAVADLRVLFWEDGGVSLREIRKRAPGAQSIVAVTGAEGGFSTEEAGAARAAGFEIASLGPRVLRAETAAVVAATLVAFEWGDLG